MKSDAKSQDISLPAMKQVCPYCLAVVDSLFGHECADLPPNFHFSQKIEQAPFFYDLYQKADGINQDGDLDIHKLHPIKYQIFFLRVYSKWLDLDYSDQISELQHKHSVILKQDQKESTENSSSADKTHKLKRKKIKQVCPFCMEEFSSLVNHHCELMQHKRPDFSFREDLLMDSFFVYLYREFDAYTARGFVKIRRLNKIRYYQLFFKIYDRMASMDSPSLDKARIDKLFPEVQSEGIFSLKHTEQQIKEQARQKAQKKQRNQMDQVCPYCFHVFPTLVGHQCPNLPDGFNFSPKLHQAKFFEELYRKTHALSPKKTIDLHKINRSLYQSQFLEYHDALLHNSKVSSQSLVNQNSITEKSPKSHDLLESELDPDLVKEFEEEFNQVLENSENNEDLDILEIMAQDLDMGFRKSGRVSSSLTDNLTDISGLGGSLNEEKSQESNEQIPLCFSCRNMMNCPRGLNSDQMEHVFSCSDYVNMEEEVPKESDRQAQSIGEVPQDISICPICEYIDQCPKWLSAEEMESVFSCDEFQPAKENTIPAPANLQSKSPDLTNEQKAILAEVLGEWRKTKGQLRVYCRKCEAEMKKVVTTRKMFYRCANYPECNVTGDPWYIAQAVTKQVISHVDHGDLLILYQYNEAKNIVWVSHIYSEGKLFLK